MSDEFWRQIPAILTAVGVLASIVIALFNRKTIVEQGNKLETGLKVIDTVEKQTNSMNLKMQESAQIKGEKIGEDRTIAKLATGADLPISVKPVETSSVVQPVAPDAEIEAWIAKGAELLRKKKPS